MKRATIAGFLTAVLICEGAAVADFLPGGYSGPTRVGGTSGQYRDITQMAFNPTDPDHLYAARYNFGEPGGVVTRYDYSTATGMVSNPTTVAVVPGAALGLAFFKNNLYVSTTDQATHLGGIIRYSAGPGGTFVNRWSSSTTSRPASTWSISSRSTGPRSTSGSGPRPTRGSTTPGASRSRSITGRSPGSPTWRGRITRPTAPITSPWRTSSPTPTPASSTSSRRGSATPTGCSSRRAGRSWPPTTGRTARRAPTTSTKGSSRATRGPSRRRTPVPRCGRSSTSALSTPRRPGSPSCRPGRTGGDLLVGLFHRETPGSASSLGNEVVMVDQATGEVKPSMTSLTSVTDIITDPVGRILLSDFGPNFDNGYDPKSGGIYELTEVPEPTSGLLLLLALPALRAASARGPGREPPRKSRDPEFPARRGV